MHSIWGSDHGPPRGGKGWEVVGTALEAGLGGQPQGQQEMSSSTPKPARERTGLEVGEGGDDDLREMSQMPWAEAGGGLGWQGRLWELQCVSGIFRLM